RRHTRFSRDWSSDVCSSDLDAADPIPTPPPRLTEAEVHALAESALSSRMTGSRVTGSRVTGLSPLAGSVGNQNFRLDGPDGPWRSEERRVGKGRSARWAREP